MCVCADLSCNGNPGGREVLLAFGNGRVQFLQFLSQSLHLSLPRVPLVVGSLYELHRCRGCVCVCVSEIIKLNHILTLHDKHHKRISNVQNLQLNTRDSKRERTHNLLFSKTVALLIFPLG